MADKHGTTDEPTDNYPGLTGGPRRVWDAESIKEAAAALREWRERREDNR